MKDVPCSCISAFLQKPGARGVQAVGIVFVLIQKAKLQTVKAIATVAFCNSHPGTEVPFDQ